MSDRHECESELRDYQLALVERDTVAEDDWTRLGMQHLSAGELHKLECALAMAWPVVG